MAVRIPIWTVDSFTNKPFTGNPAGVCLLEKDLNIRDEIKQKIAAEMNISETCFVTPISEGDFCKATVFSLRWFTPTDEVPLCGQATLAAATVLREEKKNVNSCIQFSTLSGIFCFGGCA